MSFFSSHLGADYLYVELLYVCEGYIRSVSEVVFIIFTYIYNKRTWIFNVLAFLSALLISTNSNTSSIRANKPTLVLFMMTVVRVKLRNQVRQRIIRPVPAPFLFQWSNFDTGILNSILKHLERFLERQKGRIRPALF